MIKVARLEDQSLPPNLEAALLTFTGIFTLFVGPVLKPGWLLVIDLTEIKKGHIVLDFHEPDRDPVRNPIALSEIDPLRIVVEFLAHREVDFS